MNNDAAVNRLLIGSAPVTNPLLFADCQLTCIETRQEILYGKSGRQHPIRPGG
jgi:hypothetical protein